MVPVWEDRGKLGLCMSPGPNFNLIVLSCALRFVYELIFDVGITNSFKYIERNVGAHKGPRYISRMSATTPRRLSMELVTVTSPGSPSSANLDFLDPAGRP